METQLIAALRSERQSFARRRKMDREIKALFSGGAVVLSGLLAAALYAMLTHQI
jgi:hypothetical protein